MNYETMKEKKATLVKSNERRKRAKKRRVANFSEKKEKEKKIGRNVKLRVGFS